MWDTVSAVSNLLPRPKLDGSLSKQVTYAYHAISIDERRLQFPPSLWKDAHVLPHQTVEQVWFAPIVGRSLVVYTSSYLFAARMVRTRRSAVRVRYRGHLVAS